MKSGILLLHKPTGISSARAIAPLKRVFSGRRIGHTGTLDPFAEGLMVVLVGSATRLSRWFLKLDKWYTARVLLGAETDTLDTEGQVVVRAPAVPFHRVEAAIPQFLGTIQQVPPAFSALKIAGRRAYQRARQGEQVEIPAREVTIHRLELAPIDGDSAFTMQVDCGSGTYIRALARDLARAAGTVGHCTELFRTGVGPFHDREATTVDRLAGMTDPESRLISATDAVRALGNPPILRVPKEVARRLVHGTPIQSLTGLIGDLRNLDCREVLLAAEEGDRALAIVAQTERGWGYETVFPPEDGPEGRVAVSDAAPPEVDAPEQNRRRLHR